MQPVLGEFLGTMILILLGDGVVAGVLLARSKAHGAGWLAITTAWAFAVLCGIFTAKACGAPGYINPVGPIVDLVNGKLTAGMAGMFIAAQIAGAFAGAVLVWLHYLPHWSATADAGLKLGCFCTSPAIRNAPANVLTEAIGTFTLVFVGTAMAADKSISDGLGNTLVAALVWGIGLSLGGTTGYAINPARDLGPRLAHAVLPIPGKGGSDWGYSWVPIIGPIIGSICAALAARFAFL